MKKVPNVASQKLKGHLNCPYFLNNVFYSHDNIPFSFASCPGVP